MKCRETLILVLGLSVASLAAKAASTAAETNSAPAPLALPALRAIRLEPSSVTLKDGRDVRKVLVLGETKTGDVVDLTSTSVFRAENDSAEVDAEGYLTPKSKGETHIAVSAGGLSAKLAVKIEDASLPPVRFVRDIQPIFAKVGCNAGTCHGSAKGKNGFKLSLRGYDPEFDYQALINDLSGRRFNRVVVEESLMLLKPTAEVPHEGRQALKPGSRYYTLIRDWIAQGTKHEDAAEGRATSIEVFPKEVQMDLPGRTQQLAVLAHYKDGSTRDVTREAVFTSNNNDVAPLKENKITAARRGEAAILVRYEGCYETRQVAVMGDRTGYLWASQPEFNYVDRHVYAKLKKIKALPSELCNDAEFIRRVTIDLTGMPPALSRVREFLADKSPSRQKREKLVEELIGTKDFMDNWANKWADLLQCNSENLGEKGVWVFKDWIREQIAKNAPYDQFVRSLLLARGSSYMNPEVNYLRVLREPGKIAEDVSQTFLGVRFNCNKCHDHPFEKWTQNQYYEFGAYFARVGFKRGTFGSEVVRNFTGDPITVTGEEIVYLKYDGGEVKHPKTDKDVAPKVPFGTADPVAMDSERRDAFVKWLTSKENPLFAKSLVNRTWSYFLGRGIIDPVDDIRGSNPASNPELLEALTKDFIEHNFDVRQLMRTIVNSRTYQLSIIPNKWNSDDTINFSHSKPRRLSAEQLLGAIEIATGHRPKFQGLPEGMRAVEAPDGLIQGDDFLALFGRPKRQSACECERSSNVTLSHALNLINGSVISEAVSSSTNRMAQIVEAEKSPEKIVEAIYMSVLSRPPTAAETAAVDMKDESKRLETAQDLAWALMNSPSFLFNR